MDTRSDDPSAPPEARRFAATDARHLRRREREVATIRLMVRMYCRDHHPGPVPCTGCAELLDYAERRIQRCVFGAAKPTCANCRIHCYTAGMRERVRDVMRYAGPRMPLRHPVLAIAHLIDGRRPAPPLPVRPRARTVLREEPTATAPVDGSSGPPARGP